MKVLEERASKGDDSDRLRLFSFALHEIQEQDYSPVANIVLTRKLLEFYNSKISGKEEEKANNIDITNLNFKDFYKSASSGNPKALAEYRHFKMFLGVGKDFDTEVDTEEGTVSITIYWRGLFPGMLVGGPYNKEVNERLLKAIATTK